MSLHTNSTKERLTQALIDAGAPEEMLVKARCGEYDSYEAVIVDLVKAAKSFGLHDIAKRAMNGEFDATKEESDAWWNSKGRSMCPSAMRHLFEGGSK